MRFSLLLLIFFFLFTSISKGQKTDLIKIEGWGFNTSAITKIQSCDINDSTFVVISKQMDRNFLLTKYNKSNKITDHIELQFDISNSLQSVGDVIDVKCYNRDIYVLFRGNSDYLLKVDDNFKVKFLKRISDNSLFLKFHQIEILGDNIFLSSSNDSITGLIKIDTSGILIDKKFFLTSGPPFNTTINVPITIWNNNIVLGSIIYYPNSNVYSHLILTLFDQNLNISSSKQFRTNPGNFFWLNNLIIGSNNNLIVLLTNFNNSRFGKMVLNPSLVVLNKSFYSLKNGQISNSDFLYSNSYFFQDSLTNIYLNRTPFNQLPNPWETGWRYDLTFTRSHSNYSLGTANAREEIHNWSGEGSSTIDLGFNFLGMRIKNNYISYYTMNDLDTSNRIGIDPCNKCFLEISTLNNLNQLSVCHDTVPVMIDSFPELSFISSNFGTQIQSFNYNIVNSSYTTKFKSLNQIQNCGPAFDTCSVLYAKIVEDSFSICQSENAVLHSLTHEARNYRWYLDTILIDTDPTLNYNFDSAGTFNLVLEVDAGTNQTCFYRDSIVVTVYPLPENILNDTTICANDTTQLNLQGATQVIWAPSTGLSCNTCINPTVVLQDSQFYFINAQNQFGCQFLNEVNINVYPKPEATISGSNTVCPGVSEVWFGLNPLDSFIASWWIDTIGVITQDFGDSIYTTWPQGIDSAFVYAYVQYPAGCEGDTIRFKVKVNQLLEPRILVNEDSICYSDRENVTYNLSYNTSGSIYLWEIENGQILSGDSTSSIKVSWDSVGLGKLIVREYSTTNIDTCFGSDSIEIEILPNPENDLSLTGKENVCLEEDVSYAIIPGWINSTYDWIAFGSSNLTGNGTESIEISWGNTGDFLVSVEEVSEYGCRGLKDSLEVTVHPIPEPQRVGDDTLLCLGDPALNAGIDNREYEVAGFNGSSFNWIVEGGIIKSGQGSNQIVVTWDSSLIKSLRVIEISEFGCESEELQIKQYFDLSRLELFVVSVSEDSSISLDFELESLRSYPGDSIWIARRSEVGDPGSGPGIFGDWARIVRIPKTSTDYRDQNINPNESSYGYRVEGKNTCEQEIKSRDHSSILLTGIRNPGSEIRGNTSETITLNWTSYRNWDGGVKSYELYEKFDSVYVKVAEANQTELTYDPRIPKKEHCFRVRAVQNGEERESWSNAFCIELERRLNIPNVVTPNGDNKNDKLQIENLEAYPDHELTIYNRWGQEVFKITQYQNNWPEDNTISGTYFYRMQIRDELSGMEENYKGWVQVLR